MHLNRTLAASLFLCASAVAADPKPTQESKPTAAVASACAQVPLFQRYARKGMVDTLPEGHVRLSVVTDSHGADCGTPDCYFTSVKAVFHLSTKGGDCRVREVEVSTEEGGCIPEDQRSPPRRESFFTKGAVNLADPELQRLTLRTRKGDRALVILPDNLFYFEDVKAGAPLHTTLPSGDVGEPECCWGASIAASHFLEEGAQ
ncbi:hypothetical protein [Pyxidicoccus caerfyrddinensis]|uniref:hypothetical protein n=1 Tax=Pyxidicoccus caerfyrddinensis TaxID=2709663 RepID=UPI0013D9DD51|nr:hypothetical protein [Pyxidicoccus caerfyrddinensis]